MSITEFTSSIQKNGYAKTNRFQVLLYPPPAVITKNAATASLTSELVYLCESAQIPGSNIESQQVRHFGMPIHVAGQKNHDNLDLQFRVDKNLSILNLFDFWMEVIYNEKLGEIGYYNDYVSTCMVDIVDNAGWVSQSYLITECYPIIISPIGLDWLEENQYMKLNISFAFKECFLYEMQNERRAIGFNSDSLKILTKELKQMTYKGQLNQKSLSEILASASQVGKRVNPNEGGVIPKDNSMQAVKNAIEYGASLVKNNIKTQIGQKYQQLSGITNKF